MTLDEIFNRVLVEAGQFLITTENIELNRETFVPLVKSAIGTYNRYYPIDNYLDIDFSSSRNYTFTEANTPDGIPREIAEVIPVRIMGTYPYILKKYDDSESNVEVAESFPFTYRRPVLTIPANAICNVHAIFDHELRDTTPSSGGVKQYEINTVNENSDVFFQLLTGRFLKGLGRSRKAFTLNDLPVTNDGPEMVAEGQEMEKDALEELRENKGKWWLAW